MGKGQISRIPNRRMHVILAANFAWLVVVCLLGAWWGRLLATQAERIAFLETRAGVSASAAHEQWARTHHMLVWESSSFFLMLLTVTAMLLWLYWREAQRTRSLEAFFASVTHELRTPLTSIRLQAESIADVMTCDADERQLIDRLLEDTSRLESQVERTLELARVEGGGSVLSQPLRFKPWFEYFLQCWGESGGSRRLLVDAHLDECLIQADPAAVQVIVKNLLENSLKHSGRTLAAETLEPVRVAIRSESRENWVVLHYSDNGRPFEGDPRRLGKLFSKGPSSQGAGVGLYLVDMLMRRMGGRVEFSAGPRLETALWFRRTANHG